jgi:hypothetical protein
MTKYRIVRSRNQIEKTPARSNRPYRQERQLVKHQHTLWQGYSQPETALVAEFAVGEAESRSLSAVAVRPLVLSEQILSQQQRFPKFLGWKTLQMVDMEPLLESEVPTEAVVRDAPEGFARRIMAFVMDNDPILHVAKH